MDSKRLYVYNPRPGQSSGSAVGIGFLPFCVVSHSLSRLQMPLIRREISSHTGRPVMWLGPHSVPPGHGSKLAPRGHPTPLPELRYALSRDLTRRKRRRTGVARGEEEIASGPVAA